MNTTNRNVYPQDIFAADELEDSFDSDEENAHFHTHDFDRVPVHPKTQRRKLDNIDGTTTVIRGSRTVRDIGFKINEESILEMDRKRYKPT